MVPSGTDGAPGGDVEENTRRVHRMVAGHAREEAEARSVLKQLTGALGGDEAYGRLGTIDGVGLTRVLSFSSPEDLKECAARREGRWKEIAGQSRVAAYVHEELQAIVRRANAEQRRGYEQSDHFHHVTTVAEFGEAASGAASRRPHKSLTFDESAAAFLAAESEERGAGAMMISFDAGSVRETGRAAPVTYSMFERYDGLEAVMPVAMARQREIRIASQALDAAIKSTMG